MTTRRNFLTHGCQLGLASTTLSSNSLQLAFARQVAAATTGDYRALVCILLAGGNDSLNMVVPNDADQYAEYSGLRADLALPRSSLLPLAGTSNGRNYALHPGMPEVQSMYSAGDLAVLANLGTLVEATDASGIISGSAKSPLGLYSHADQIAQWQTSTPDRRIGQRWGGRIGDLLASANTANGISMNISLSGTNLFQSGFNTVEYGIEASGEDAVSISAYDDGTEFGAFRKQMIDELLSVPQTNLLRREYRKRLRGSIDAQAVFVDALQNSTGPNAAFSTGPFSAVLKQVANVIAARDQLGACRQTFFVQVGGWDHHDEVLVNQSNMLPAVSKGLAEFRDALLEIGMFNNVTTFTTSDFARTLTSNGRGSDHGWGGHHLVMGGSVQGGQMFGVYPILSANSPLDTGRGVYVPTTAVDQYFAELALWLGVSPNDLDEVLPNVRRFCSPESATPPLGFLA